LYSRTVSNGKPFRGEKPTEEAFSSTSSSVITGRWERLAREQPFEEGLVSPAGLRLRRSIAELFRGKKPEQETCLASRRSLVGSERRQTFPFTNVFEYL